MNPAPTSPVIRAVSSTVDIEMADLGPPQRSGQSQPAVVTAVQPLGGAGGPPRPRNAAASAFVSTAMTAAGELLNEVKFEIGSQLTEIKKLFVDGPMGELPPSISTGYVELFAAGAGIAAEQALVGLIQHGPAGTIAGLTIASAALTAVTALQVDAGLKAGNSGPQTAGGALGAYVAGAAFAADYDSRLSLDGEATFALIVPGAIGAVTALFSALLTSRRETVLSAIEAA
jgi:hypothetical protein